MNLLTLINNLDLTLVAGDGQAELSDLTDDSRRVTPGNLFIARETGDDRWRGYVEAAIKRGAIAAIAPAEVALAESASAAEVSVAVGPKIDQALAGRLAARFFDHPAEKLKLLGVTGTNGKTTVATLTQFLLNAAGMKCGLLGTVAIDHGDPEGPQPAELTTPGAIDLHRHFAAMVKHGCDACAMEVSSHALDQGRVDGLAFAVAVFTNLTQDHLDYHGTMENYAAAKAKLFAGLGTQSVAVINADDPAGCKMVDMLPTGVIWTTIDLEAVDDGIRIFNSAAAQRFAADHTDAIFELQGTEFRVILPLAGRHNLMNALQAATAAMVVAGCNPRQLIQPLETLAGVPGRLESVRIEAAKSPAVLVDYAHTPDALENVLHALRPLIPGGGKLIVVFGCGGDRDRRKRPLMAQAACGLADVAVLTSDNPRTEDPQQILDDAIAGVPPEVQAQLVVEIDRATAIAAAIRDAKADDTVLVAGKGHEDYQILGTEKIHFDDREHAAAALQDWVDHRKPGDGHPPALSEGRP